MRMKSTTVTASKVFPLLGVFGSVAVSRKGVLTVGWELTFPTAYTVEEKEYDDMLQNFSSAMKVLPEWSLVHRQDIFTYDEYTSPEKENRGYLETCYDEHFNGRRHLVHRSYLFLSFAGRNHIDKAGQYSGLFGIRGSVQVPSMKAFNAFRAKASEFMSIFAMGGQIKYRELKEDDWLGTPHKAGIVQSYMMLGNESRLMSDIRLEPDAVSVYDKVAQAYVIGESDELPTEIDSTSRVANLSSVSNEVRLSFAAPLGVLLDCEHAVNQYIIIPPQAEVIHKLEKERNKMSSGISSADNRINAAEINEFLDDAYKEGLFTVRTQTHVLAWGPDDQHQQITGKISAALSSMGVAATYNNYNTPILYYAGIPSNGFEIGKENLMLMELCSSLTLSPYETFETGIPDGMFRICDRMRNVPVVLDTQRAARRAGWIDNYNMFILGGSGTGKSFFTNFYVRNCYDAGESVFIIDVGDSYEGLCSIINEESGGKDGAYLSWDKDHPFSFNPFLDIDRWKSPTGGLNTDEPGVNFFMSFLTTAWAPTDGWTSDTKSILTQFITDFLSFIDETRPIDPVFDNFYNYLDKEITPRILYSAPEVTSTGKPRAKSAIDADNRKHGYWVGNIRITPSLINIEKFVLSLKNYSKTGSYSFLLNEPHPRDLFTSRFTVFEVDKLSQDDNKFYSLCILCIMNSFERKMRGSMDFKNMIIEEAWKAISNETMAPYLAGLWKTARKFNTSAVVVSQEIEDIINSPAIKTAILDNSSIKVLLDQSNHLNTFGKLQELLSLTQKDRNIILSMNRSPNPNYRYKEVFFNLGGKRSFVAATEVSPQEAVAFESAKDLKEPFLQKAKELGSYRKAIDFLTGRNQNK